MALIASMGQQFVLTAEMDAAAAATYTITNPVGAVQASTGNTSFTIVRVEVQWAAFDGAATVSTVQVAHVDSALTSTNLFAAALNAIPTGVSIMPSLTTATYVAEAVADNSAATSTVFTGTDKITITTVDADTKVHVRLYCITGGKTLTVS